jgi:hypothetical protein
MATIALLVELALFALVFSALSFIFTTETQRAQSNFKISVLSVSLW